MEANCISDITKSVRSINLKTPKRCFACENEANTLRPRRKLPRKKATPIAKQDTVEFNVPGTSAIPHGNFCKSINGIVPHFKVPLPVADRRVQIQQRLTTNNTKNVNSLNSNLAVTNWALNEAIARRLLSTLPTAYLKDPGKYRLKVNKPGFTRFVSDAKGGKYGVKYSIFPNKTAIQGSSTLPIIIEEEEAETAAQSLLSEFKTKNIDISHIVSPSDYLKGLTPTKRMKLVGYLHNLQKQETAYTGDLFDSEDSLIRECAYDAITLQVTEDLYWVKC